MSSGNKSLLRNMLSFKINFDEEISDKKFLLCNIDDVENLPVA